MGDFFKRKATVHGLLLCLFLVFFSTLLFGSKQLSLTSDEPPHIVHGYVMLKTGDTWALPDHRHPPLLNMLSAAPLILQQEQPDPRSIPSWDKDFVLFVRALWPQLGPIARLAFVTRYPNIMLSVLLLALVIRWSGQISKYSGSIFAAILCIIDPTLIAHAQLNTTDIGFSFFALLTIYLVTNIPGKKPTLNFVYIGIALGCAMVTKASGLILAPVVVFLMLLRALHNKHTHKDDINSNLWIGLKSWLAGSLTVGFFALLYVMTTYAVPRWLSADHNIVSSLVAHFDLSVLTFTERYRSAFLAGDIRQGGWWWYFPFAYLIKTPIPSILLSIATALFYFLQPKKLSKWVSIWIFPVVYIISAVRSNLNIGIRHLLPIYPFLYISVGVFLHHIFTRPFPVRLTFPWLKKSTRISSNLLRFLIIFLLLWQAVEIAAVFPFSLSYFNLVAGGPKNGYHYLVDSNIDWGQSFIALKTYMQEKEIPWIWLSYYTWIDPAEYDVTYRPLPPNSDSLTIPRRFNPPPGDYAISATTLQGVMMADPNLYDWFRHRIPDAQPGYGLLVYHVEPPRSSMSWVAQCTVPIAPLSPVDISSGFGPLDLRIIYYDCTTAWIYPEGGTEPGWTIIHKETRVPDDSFINDMLQNNKLSYQQNEPGILPPFEIYEQVGNSLPTTLPIHAVFGDWLVLTGYSIPIEQIKPGKQLEVLTQWSVSSVPDRPLSLMLHLVHKQTGATYTGDALGIPATEWREGDIILQRHKITLPPDIQDGPYDVEVGVYWLDTLERWKVISQQQTGNNAVVMTQLTRK